MANTNENVTTSILQFFLQLHPGRAVQWPMQPLIKVNIWAIWVCCWTRAPGSAFGGVVSIGSFSIQSALIVLSVSPRVEVNQTIPPNLAPCSAAMSVPSSYVCFSLSSRTKVSEELMGRHLVDLLVARICDPTQQVALIR